ncbi:MAG: hypothetical protein RLY23_887 [Actinomycetota bacterium]
MAGSRLGFIRHFAIWLGLFLGGVLGIVLQPSVADRFASSSDAVVLSAPLLSLLICSGIGATLFGAASRALRSPNRVTKRPFLALDRTFGAVAGVAAVAFLAWALTPVVTATRYWPVEISDGSEILKAIERNAPSIPETLVTAAQTYANASDGEIEGAGGVPGTDSAQTVLPPKAPALSQSVSLAVRAATLRVEGRACSLIQDGTGVVIARDLVVTNAHVIAGENGSTSVSNGEIRRRADVVAFDPRRDIAVLRINNLGIKPLKFSSPLTDTNVAIFGYPGGRELRAEGGRIVEQIKATGGDLYGKGNWSREILILAADLVPGDSGGPVVSRTGRLLGLSFAIDPRLSNTSYALDPSEVRAVLKTVGLATVGTGKCLGK